MLLLCEIQNGQHRGATGTSSSALATLVLSLWCLACGQVDFYLVFQFIPTSEPG